MRANPSLVARVVRNRLVWLCLVFVVAGGTCLAISTGLFWLEWQYHHAATKTAGTILRKWKESSSGGSVGGTTSIGTGLGTRVASYMIRYEYRTAAEDRLQGEDSVNSAYWERIQPGNSLSVFYLPQRPNHSRLWLGTRWSMPLILFFIGLPMTFMGVLIECLMIGDLRRKHALRARRAQGLKTAATSSN